jgi:hypothetical protein
MEEKNNTQVTESEAMNGAQQAEQAENVKESNEKLFSQEELDSIIEKRLSKERKKYEAKLKEEVNQAERMAQMSEAEKQQALFEKRVKEFEEREAAFNAAQEALNKEKMLTEVNKQLVARNLPIDFAEKLISDDAETTMANISKFEIQWQAAINNAVDSRLKGTTPTSPLRKNEPSKKDVSKMSFSEFAKHKKNNN